MSPYNEESYHNTKTMKKKLLAAMMKKVVSRPSSNPEDGTKDTGLGKSASSKKEELITLLNKINKSK